MMNLVVNLGMARTSFLLLFISCLTLGCANESSKARGTISLSAEPPPAPVYYTHMEGWLDLGREDSTLILAMPYATTDNFLNEKIYPCAKCLLRDDAGRALLKAQKEAQRKGYIIVLLDCYRPLPLQQKMFDIMPDTKYVGDPTRGSKHNKGVAVDLTLEDENAKPLDMGTAFDDFSDKAHFNSKEISLEAKKNRTLLRAIMLSCDFVPYDNEWWHFNFKNKNFANAAFLWDCDE